ncbi:phosphoesterase [Thalassoroseus pseudoceratinae]|uniref:phosphoesterase n=1 Tax=Thalassoroseus pseudoceratinae TaxID=2713176 RepID=UPI0014227E5A|nr:phosphoesterase [Thalassoroseus pseudoceratinae]
MSVEQILVVPTILFHEIGYFQGFLPATTPVAEQLRQTLFDPAHTSFRPRPEMEQDPSFKQLIPYCIFRHDGKIFSYTRGTAQGESRLHAKRSIGIGGHISSDDDLTDATPYEVGMQREIDEEVYLETGYRHEFLGLINDDDSEVGRVHLGVVHVFDLDEPKVRPREESIQETGFADPDGLVSDRAAFETWSQFCLDYLISLNGF